MLAYCVNEGCGRPLHSFSEGRLFQFEVVSISVAASDEKSEPFDERPQRQTLHLWLCGRCASTMTVVLEPAQGVKVISLDKRSEATQDMSPMNASMSQAKEC
jgi:hypothetical protein